MWWLERSHIGCSMLSSKKAIGQRAAVGRAFPVADLVGVWHPCTWHSAQVPPQAALWQAVIHAAAVQGRSKPGFPPHSSEGVQGLGFRPSVAPTWKRGTPPSWCARPCGRPTPLPLLTQLQPCWPQADPWVAGLRIGCQGMECSSLRHPPSQCAVPLPILQCWPAFPGLLLALSRAVPPGKALPTAGLTGVSKSPRTN